MFCTSCGKEIYISDARFCSCCGKIIPEFVLKSLSDEQNTNVLLNNEMENRKQIVCAPSEVEEVNLLNEVAVEEGTFQIAGKKIVFSDEQKAQVVIVAQFEEEAEKHANNYIEFYRNNDINVVATKSDDKIWKEYYEMAAYVNKRLVKCGIIGLESSDIADYAEYPTACDLARKIYAEKKALDSAREMEYAYRAARKNARRKVLGGGFGLSGALKGIAMAGTINAMTGAAHGMINVLGNATTNIKYRNQMESLKYSGISGEIAKALKKDCMSFLNAFIHYLEINNYEEFLYDSRAQKKAQVIFEQSKEKGISINKRINMICEAIKCFPAKKEYYEELCFLTGDKNDELERCMEYFSLDSTEFIMIKASKCYADLLIGKEYIQLLEQQSDSRDYDVFEEIRLLFEKKLIRILKRILIMFLICFLRGVRSI